MKTFAYLALIGTTLAIRLTESTGAVDGAATEQVSLEQAELTALGEAGLEQLGSLTVEDLGEDAALCLRDATRGVLADRGLPESDVDAVDEALTAGALERDAEGKLKNDLADFAGALDQVGRQMGGDTDDIEEGLKEIAKRSVKCAKRKEAAKKGKKQGGDAPAGGESADEGAGAGAEEGPAAPETTLAQAPEEAMKKIAQAVDGLGEQELKELKKKAKKAAKKLGLTEDEAKAVGEAAQQGDVDAIVEAAKRLPQDTQDELVEAVAAELQ